MTLLALHAIANNNGGLNAAEQPLKTGGQAKLYIPSTLNTDYLQLIVCAVKY